jgi:UDP-N-acetylmuramoylalanine--D-glutamate ligase
MRVAELGSRRIAVWGLGREGRAAINLLRQRHPQCRLVLLDDAADARPPDGIGADIECAFGAERIVHAIQDVDVIVKSPGVSLYRHEIRAARGRGVKITSLLNLWFAKKPEITTICVTGTKGKSTTASLIAHILKKLDARVALVGNIGVPITEIDRATRFAVIEVSSYQAADFDGLCDVAVLTSLYPEHLDWHLSVENYFRDKIHLLNHSQCRIINRETAEMAQRFGLTTGPSYFFNDQSRIHYCDIQILDGSEVIGEVRNSYLARPHNMSNLCAALAVAKSLGLEIRAALAAASGFRSLPHRQEELGEVEGVLFVDDSISTIPESTLSALAVYAGRAITLIVGGYDRGIDYEKLVQTIKAGAAKAVICLGDSGKRIYSLAQSPANGRPGQTCPIHEAKSMAEAVSLALRLTPSGGVVLLSPAAPSYGTYRDYIERGEDFAARAGFIRARA